MTKKCPTCQQSDEVHVNHWGMPVGEPDPMKYFVGGCIVWADMPDKKCLRCSTEFYETKKAWRNRFVWDSFDGMYFNVGSAKTGFLRA